MEKLETVNPPVQRSSVEAMVTKYNQIAMNLMAEKKFVEAVAFLKKAERLLFDQKYLVEDSQRSKLLSLTLNNLSCYYKKTRKPNAALFYIQNALEIELKDETVDPVVLAGTHLNVCAILQSLKNYSTAVTSAKCAIDLVFRALVAKTGVGIDGNSLE